MPNYDDKSVKELDAILIDLGNQRDDLHAEATAATEAYNAKVSQANAEALIEKLSEDDLAAFTQAVSARSIASDEVVATPGGSF